MAKSYGKSKARQEGGQFITIPHCVLESENFIKLSGNAIKLLVDLLHQYNGRNNGSFVIAWSHMSKKEGKRGWNNKGTLKSALKELTHFGFIIQTKAWGRHDCSQYAITWKQIDVSDDVSIFNSYVKTKAISNLYKHPKPEYTKPPRKKKAKLTVLNTNRSRKREV